MRRSILSIQIIIALYFGGGIGFSLDKEPLTGLDRYKAHRDDIFEFEKSPVNVRDGDQITIQFETKGYCDVTVAIENPEGRIVRHLASGLLGPNAPAPFAKGTKSQSILWDGKDDQGRYVDDMDGHIVRVSLGLKASFERSLFWEPKRIVRGQGLDSNQMAPTSLICAAPEGVYEYSGRSVDHIRMYDHEGNYVKTVYPFPANKLDEVKGLEWWNSPAEGRLIPKKRGVLFMTMLTCGATSDENHRANAMYGSAASAMGVRNGRIAISQRCLNRLATDGSTGNLPLDGPDVTVPIRLGSLNRTTNFDVRVTPKSIALSPDGTWLYLSGYMWRIGVPGIDENMDCLHGVARMKFGANDAPKPFLGSMKQDDSGNDDRHFRDATSVAVDHHGRVYVSDYMNNRIQVHSADGRILKSISAKHPVKVMIHHRTGHIYIASWFLGHDHTSLPLVQDAREKNTSWTVKPTLTELGPFDNPELKATYDLPLLFGRNEGPTGYADTYHGRNKWWGLEHYIELDSWTDPPTFWLVTAAVGAEAWLNGGIRLLVPEGGKLVVRRDFAKEVKDSIGTANPIGQYLRQRLYANPRTGHLYIAEQQTAAREKACSHLFKVNPETGKTERIRMPFDSEDFAFGMDGEIYLRENRVIVRYDSESWREIPFDYGIELSGVSFAKQHSNATMADVISGLPIWATGTLWHQGGLSIAPNGDIAVSVFNNKGGVFEPPILRNEESLLGQVKRYEPRYFPGRFRFGEIHVWNKHGELIQQDAVQGLHACHGIGLDASGDLYVLHGPAKLVNGKEVFPPSTATLMKFRPGKGRIYTDDNGKAPQVVVKMSPGEFPERPPDLKKRDMRLWVEGAEWSYGGVGYCGRNESPDRGMCSCFNCRFALDYFGRSFAPESTTGFTVAVLDSSGNVILRIGQYGNADSQGARSLVPLGGDEVGIFYAAYLATVTDKRLFIADVGNARIASVKLGYHLEHRASIGTPP